MKSFSSRHIAENRARGPFVLQQRSVRHGEQLARESVSHRSHQRLVFKNVIEPKEPGGQKKSVRSVNLQCRYQDVEEKWQSTTSFQLSDLPIAIRVLQLAQQYVESVEAEVTS